MADMSQILNLSASFKKRLKSYQNKTRQQISHCRTLWSSLHVCGHLTYQFWKQNLKKVVELTKRLWCDKIMSQTGFTSYFFVSKHYLKLFHWKGVNLFQKNSLVDTGLTCEEDPQKIQGSPFLASHEVNFKWCNEIMSQSWGEKLTSFHIDRNPNL